MERDELDLETRLQNAIATPGEVISISGPSKSGKTVLVERVVGTDNLITVTGAGIRSGDDLWNRILDWMGAPSSTEQTRAHSTDGRVAVKAEGSLGVPLVAKGKVGAAAEAGHERSEGQGETVVRRGMAQVVADVADSDFVLLIDDFHYMDRSVQQEVSKEVKEAARQGVKICAASVPHRSDDVVRSNPELRGRVQAIDLSYWSISDLIKIGRLGFPELRLVVPDEVLNGFAVEASGSPQLMQALCLQLCFEEGVSKACDSDTHLQTKTRGLRTVLAKATSRADYSSLVRRMHTGPKQRGQERKEYAFVDGSTGDVYRSVLLAIASDPPALSFAYADLMARVAKICEGDSPRPQSIMQACGQMAVMALDMYPDQRVLEWDDDETAVEIIDPYLRFYLRWSPQLASLGED